MTLAVSLTLAITLLLPASPQLVEVRQSDGPKLAGSQPSDSGRVSPKLVESQTSEGVKFPATIRVMPGSPARVELTNTGTQPITAWSFTVATPTATGVHREGHSADVYLSEVTGNLPGAQPHLDRIMPGQSRALPVDTAGAEASVQLTALILQDGTGLGDPAALKTFFDRRATEREQLRQVADAFRTVLASKRGTAALEDLRQRLRSGIDESEPRRTAREAVDALLQKAKAGSEDDADRSVLVYADFVARQYETAVAHAPKKQ
jgi:hypothetical protein